MNNFTQFSYDGLWRNTKIVETTSGSVTSTKQFVWSQEIRCEERDAGGTTVRQSFRYGQYVTSTSLFYARNHIGSVTEMTDSSGNPQASYAFLPFGERAKLLGTLDSPFQFATYYSHQRSGLDLTVFRDYKPTNARWLSRDPIHNPLVVTERLVGPNLYSYCYNNPVNFYDPLGLTACCENADPLPSDSPSCQNYGGANGSTFLGASETCVCRCMGDSNWAQKIRGCLACEAKQGTNVWARHGICYAAGAASDPAGAAVGLGTLAICGTSCAGGSAAW